jgi:hypothetical protein
MRAVLLTCLSVAAAQQPGNTCGDPSEGPVLGGVDFVGTYMSPTANQACDREFSICRH